ncbi:MAG: acetate kinase [Clostridia bacterium]|nr:acetate kinase [Clostridia bacterium]
MKILVINAGSSSLKYQIIEMDDESVVCKGQVERIGMDYSIVSIETFDGRKFEEKCVAANHTDALKNVFDLLLSKEYGVIKSLDEIHALGHRLIHGGETFKTPAVIDENILQMARENTILAPLHMPPQLACIEASMKLLPSTPMVAIFDTSFHQTMPDYAYMYGIDYNYYEKYKVRRYGFHGSSHQFVSEEAIKKYGADKAKRIITCHLGNGSSISAIKDGKCVDTSMGLTPLEGVIMGTRSGDLDPAVVEYLCQVENKTVSEVLNILNKKSGFVGIAGHSDNRDLLALVEKGDKKAKLACDMLAYRVRKYIGAYAAALGGVDVIVFTGGIGENSYPTREDIMKNLEYLGVEFDKDLNKNFKRKQIFEISKPSSKVKVVIIPTNEELVMARFTKDLTSK